MRAPRFVFTLSEGTTRRDPSFLAGNHSPWHRVDWACKQNEESDLMTTRKQATHSIMPEHQPRAADIGASMKRSFFCPNFPARLNFAP
jgi:hypothetical protein